ncbi:6767_t:CDS:2 [Gigaspora margarita]|uniref:6767_t:CDS:1 n=1 Tax=Gigaspora margarita TaxID=4874 RepID=A0ABN7VSL2_GIGMA|nr:6767_t:CDS:2 [Gigaspora margarita]
MEHSLQKTSQICGTIPRENIMISNSSDESELNESLSRNQEKALSIIPPIIKFFPFALSSKTTTSAVGKAPKKVLLWGDFFEEVN